MAEASILVEVKKFAEGGLGISYLPAYCLPRRSTKAKPGVPRNNDLITWAVPAISSITRHLVLYHLKEKGRDIRFVAFVDALLAHMKQGD